MRASFYAWIAERPRTTEFKKTKRYFRLAEADVSRLDCFSEVDASPLSINGALSCSKDEDFLAKNQSMNDSKKSPIAPIVASTLSPTFVGCKKASSTPVASPKEGCWEVRESMVSEGEDDGCREGLGDGRTVGSEKGRPVVGCGEGWLVGFPAVGCDEGRLVGLLVVEEGSRATTSPLQIIVPSENRTVAFRPKLEGNTHSMLSSARIVTSAFRDSGEGSAPSSSIANRKASCLGTHRSTTKLS